LGSTPAVGSSSRSSCGSWIRQAARASRCFQPPETFQAARDGLPPVRHGVDARDEIEVLPDAEVLVVAEALRHVADVALDLVLLVPDVIAEAGARAGVGREQAA
jgi:hypothetical protein